MKHVKRALIKCCGFQLLPGPLILKGDRSQRHLLMKITLQDEVG